MKKFLAAVLMVVAVFIPVVVIAAGSCVFSKVGDPATFQELTWVCTSAADGSVAAPTTTGPGYSDLYSGEIVRVIFTPGTGTLAPSDQYDVKFHRVVSGSVDTTADLFAGLGDNLGQATTKVEVPDTATNAKPFRLFRDILSPAATNVGDANAFTIQLLLDNRK